MKTALEIVMKHLLYTDNVRIQTADLSGKAMQSFQGMPDRTVYGTGKQAHILDRCIDGKKAEQGRL
jgi:hypothetical protein